MKCTSCVSARPKSDDEEASPSPTMDKPEQESSSSPAQQQYRVESPPPPPLPERASRSQPPPSVSIVEVPPDYHHGESSSTRSSPSTSSQLLRPLDVITEESSDVSDSESRPSPPKPDLCFPRPKPRYKKPKSKNLLKNLLQLRQEPTTCVLVDTRLADTAGAEEYRSICTTEIVPEEILEVEVIDLGSNSSSLADLTDIDDLEGGVEHVDDKINNNDNSKQTPELQTPDNGNGNELQRSDDRRSESVPEFEFSEEDNTGYADDFRESVSNLRFTQPPSDDALSAATTQNDDGDDDDDDDQQQQQNREDEDDDRTESDRDDERSLLAGVDRAGVVTQRPNVTEVKECTAADENDNDDASSSSDCCVTHSTTEQEEEEVVEVEEEDHLVVIVGDSGSAQSNDEDEALVMGEHGEDEAPPPPIPLPPPPAAMMAVTAAATSASVTAVTNLGQDGREGPPTNENAQISGGSDSGEADPADAHQTGKEDSGDAVEIPSTRSGSSSINSGESSVLLKILQEQPPLPPCRPPPPPASFLVENRPTFEQQISPAASENPPSLGAAAETKIDRTAKSEQLSYEIVQDHRVLRQEQTVTTSVSTTSSAGAGVGSEVILRRKPNRQQSAESGKEPSPEQKAALVHDLRNEISRIKDAELQEEFRKLELEAARIEEELSMMATGVGSGAPPPPLPTAPSEKNLTYYVSKQNDFAVAERPTAPVQPRQKPPVVVAPAPPPKPPNNNSNGNSVAKSSSNDQLYNEWQQKMEEREARRLHKVIKITKSNDSNGGAHPEPIPLVPPPPPPNNSSDDPNLEDEFLRKVKERRRKFTIPGGESDYESGSSAPASAPGTPLAGRKRIEAEFAEFAEIRRRQQQEEEREKKEQQQQNGGESSGEKEDPRRTSPYRLVALGSAIGLVAWAVCRVLFGRE